MALSEKASKSTRSIQDLVSVLAMQRATLSKRTSHLRDAVRCLRVLKSSNSNLEKQLGSIEGLKAEVARLSSETQQLEASRQKVADELEVAVGQIQNNRSEMGELQAALEIARKGLASQQSDATDHTATKEQLVHLTSQLLSSDERASNLDATISSLREQLATAETSRIQAEARFEAQSNTVTRKSLQLEEITNRARSFEMQVDDMEKQRTANDILHSQELAATQAELATQSEAHRTSASRAHELETLLAEKTSELEVVTARLEETRSVLKEAQSRVHEVAADSQSKEGIIQELRTQMDKYTTGSSRDVSDREALESQITELRDKADETLQQKASQLEKIISITAQHEQAAFALATATTELVTLREIISQLESSKQALSATIAKLEKEGKQNANMLRFGEAEKLKL